MKLICIIGILAAVTGCFAAKNCDADDEQPFSYHGKKNGPNQWPDLFEGCKGKEQSPVALRRSDMNRTAKLPRLDLVNYDQPLTKATVLNNGIAILITPEDDVERTIDIDGVTYSLQHLELHFQYGVILQIHFLHQSSDGKMALVSQEFVEDDQPDGLGEEFTGLLGEVHYREQSSELKTPLDLNSLLVLNPLPYLRYMGSLDYPPCTEGVIWIIAKYNKPINHDSFDAFYEIYSVTEDKKSDDCKMSVNLRPDQPINERKIYSSE